MLFSGCCRQNREKWTEAGQPRSAQPSSAELRSAQIICETAWNLSVKQHTAGRSGRGIFEVVQILMRYNEYVFKKMHLT